MVVIVCFYIILTTIFVNPVIGDFKSDSLALEPVFDIGDGVSAVIKAYPCQTPFPWLWSYQLLTIVSDTRELGWAQIKCADFDKIKREMSPGYINLGDAVFVSALKGQPIMVIFKMKNRTCHKKALTDESWNPLEKTEMKPLIAKECRAEIKKIRPKKVHVGSKKMVVRLDPSAFTKFVQSNINQISKQSTPHPQLSVKKTATGEMIATGAATGTAGATVIATAEQAKQPVQRRGGAKEQPLMTMLSLDTSDFDQYIPKQEEGVAWYISEQLIMTLQNVYRGHTCIRIVVIAKMTPDENEENIEIAKFKTTCGDVRGLTMYPDFIKYKKGFVFILENENEASGYFNLKPYCIFRKYTINGHDVKWTDENQNDEQCKALMSDTTGTIFNKEYKDTDYGLLAEGVYLEFVSNSSSPTEEEEKEAKEEQELEAQSGQAENSNTAETLSNSAGES